MVGAFLLVAHRNVLWIFFTEFECIDCCFLGISVLLQSCHIELAPLVN